MLAFWWPISHQLVSPPPLFQNHFFPQKLGNRYVCAEYNNFLRVFRWIGTNKYILGKKYHKGLKNCLLKSKFSFFENIQPLIHPIPNIVCLHYNNEINDLLVWGWVLCNDASRSCSPFLLGRRDGISPWTDKTHKKRLG